MPFLTPVRAELKHGTIGAILLEPLGYASERFDVEIWVPAGFDFDWGSVPVFLADAIVNPVGQTGGAFAIHDHLYRWHGLIETMDGSPCRLSRKQCDQVLFDAQLDEHLAPWRAWVCYLGVRAGGWKAWDNYGPAQETI